MLAGRGSDVKENRERWRGDSEFVNDRLSVGVNKESPLAPRAGFLVEGVYFSSWFAEGSRHGREVLREFEPGTTVRGVAPDRVRIREELRESRAGTAFPESCSEAIARATQHRPC